MSNGPSPTANELELVEALVASLAASQRSLFVALDGRRGAGKSTLARAMTWECARRGVGVAVIEGDQFYAGGSAATWDRRSAADKAAGVIDGRRQHQVLEDLRTTGSASWHPFDWEAPGWDTEHVPLKAVPQSAAIADLVVLEGAYSARPELHDLLDVLVLLDTPTERRRRQLLEREGEHYRADWSARWSAAEDYYFGTIMPPARFDLVL